MNFRASIELAGAFAGRSVSAAGVLAITVLLSRQLSLAEAGAFFEAFTILMGLAILTRCGQELRLLRTVARREGGRRTHEELSGSLAVVALASLVIGLPIMIWWSSSDAASPLKLLWLPLLPAAVTNVAAAYAKGMGKPALGALGEVGSISVVATIWLFVFPPGSALDAWLVLSFSAWVVGLIWYLILVFSGSFMLRLAIPRLPLLDEAKHLWLVSVLSYVAQWAVIFMIAIAMSTEAVAILNGLLRLLAPLQFVILTMDYFVAPYFSRESSSNINKVRSWSIATSLLVASPYAGLLIAVPETSLEFLYGLQYSPYGDELRILVAGTLLQIMLGPNGMVLNMLSRDKAMTASVILRVVVSLLTQIFIFIHPVLWIAAASFTAALVIQSIYLRAMADRAVERLSA